MSNEARAANHGYMLDTNVYALFFQNPRSPQLDEVERITTKDGIKQFLLPEVVTMEIHSVLGKYRRGGAAEQAIPCDKQIVHQTAISQCGNVCYFPKRVQLKSKAYKALRKLIDDAEAGVGPIHAAVLPTENNQIQTAKELLTKYAHRFAFGSHDAMVAGAVIAARNEGQNVTLVTSDKGLKSVCREIGIPVFDPNIAAVEAK